MLRRELGTPRVLAFANPKGGVHKTTATVLAAATIGSVRGRGVLAWDDNELRGTLGLRAGSARHARTIRHLVSELVEIENMHGDELLDAPRRLPAARLRRLVRRAGRRGEPALRPAARPAHRAPGAGPAAPHPRRDLRGHRQQRGERQLADRACRRADQLVITTVPREDAAFTADWMLDLLHEAGMGELVANAVTLISCPTPGPLAAAGRPGAALRHPDPGGGRGAVRPGAGDRVVDRVRRAAAGDPRRPGCGPPR